MIMLQDEKERLVKQTQSKDNATALQAVALLSERGWLQDRSLRNVDLTFANLQGANLAGAHLAGANFYHANLNEADLTQAHFHNAQFMGTDLSGSNLSQAELSHAQFSNANLSSANLQSAYMHAVLLGGCDLSHTNLTYADLNVAHIARCNLNRTDFTSAIMHATTFTSLDLSVAIGLETIVHRGPSTIDVETLYLSKGNIPHIFLQGFGVPDNLITHLSSLVGATIDFYSCFISYSQQDEEFAKRLNSRLRDANLRVWFAPEDIQSGRKLHEQLFEAIEYHDRLLLVLSDHSIHSEWVMTEIRRARKLEKQQHRKLFPIRLTSFETLQVWECFDADTGKDLAVEIREYFIPDFSQWKNHDEFEKSFQRLLKDLQSADGGQ
jgi:DNA polymerase III psi subunit